MCRGKHLPTYTPSMDMGAYVVVINADKVKVTGNKFADKTYFNHVTGRPGSYRIEMFKDLQKVCRGLACWARACAPGCERPSWRRVSSPEQ
jgi:ribosomal protein L13